jgi:glycine cleavage system protein P-like pyridoxal-binding family
MLIFIILFKSSSVWGNAPANAYFDGSVHPLLESGIKPGMYNNDETRLNIGNITITPGVGNATPGEVQILTEFRSFLPEDQLKVFINETFAIMNQKANEIGAIIETKLDICCQSYTVDMHEPIVEAYSKVLGKRDA